MRKFLGFMAIVGLIASPVMADLYGFSLLTSNGNANVAGQLSMDVTDAGGGQVNFTFRNNVGIASSICDVYFDDGTLLGIASITDSGAGVAFSSPATPGNLPGGNLASPAFVTTQNFSADSDSPITPNGVNAAGEWVTITFNLINGKTFADTIAALGNGDLRVGLHMQAIGTTGGSDSYINGGGPAVPAPGACLLVLIGLGLISRMRSRLS